ncbi:GNAT family N-acetyltransferase [Wandonia haliotis]|uniref:GNAT family N-acetyltransferase n=1 Tax=Wandonia haliotis TaxID=574963 RepID=A0ABP3Y2N2_9FLAO
MVVGIEQVNKLKEKYILKSKRLGFRNWTTEDVTEFAKINADPEVMEHFPKPLTEKETSELIERLQKHYEKHEYTYFATELLETGELIGFIGLAYQEYETVFNPSTDIGWRLKKSAWGKGYATEGAKRCLEFACTDLQLKRIISTCTVRNTRSENVMKKIGMNKKGEFNHPRLSDYPDFEKCVWYEFRNE